MCPNIYCRSPPMLGLPLNAEFGYAPPSGIKIAISNNGNTALNSQVDVSPTSGRSSIDSTPMTVDNQIDRVLINAAKIFTLRSQELRRYDDAKLIYPEAILPMDNAVCNVQERKKIGNPSLQQSCKRNIVERSQQKSRSNGSIGRKSPKPESFKTVMCHAWLENGLCTFGENCRFAHGEAELRPMELPVNNPKYKTKLCDKYTMEGLCPYGDRCLFIHPKAANSFSPYIRPDRFVKMQHERTDLVWLSKMVHSMEQTVSRPPPSSWPLESPAFYSARKNFENFDPSASMNEFINAYTLLHTKSENRQEFVLNDITNHSSARNQAENSACTNNHQIVKSVTPSAEEIWSTLSSDPFQFAIAADNLARSLACEFN